MYATNGNGSSYNKYNTLQFGSSSIVKFLSTLPKTQHHAPEIFIHSIYESIPNSPLYSVNISGFSLEIETNIKKFFNRTFLLISTKYENINISIYKSKFIYFFFFFISNFIKLKGIVF